MTIASPVQDMTLQQRVELLRRRSKSRLDPTLDMKKTRTFSVGTGPAFNTLGLDVAKPITLATTIDLKGNSGSTPFGNLFTFSDMALLVVGGRLTPVVDGNGAASPVVPGLDATNVTGDYYRWKFILAIEPGPDLVHVWVDGQHFYTREGLMFGSGVWADDTSTNAMTFGTEPTDLTVVSELDIYEGQVPRIFS